MDRYRMTLADGISGMSGTAHDDAGAIREASIAACDILSDELREGRGPATITIVVTTHGGRRVGAVRVTGAADDAPAGRGCPEYGHVPLRSAAAAAADAGDAFRPRPC